MNNEQELFENLHSVRDFVRLGVSYLNRMEAYLGHGYESLWDEALQLTLHALHLPVDMPVHILDARLLTAEKYAVFDYLRRRAEEKIPTAYLINCAWFAGMPFYVTEDVLIPRSPIAELIEAQFAPWIAYENVASILDLCTGSGCIAITCAKAFDEAMVDAIDISANALAIAEQNVEQHQVSTQVNLMESDLFTTLTDERYDIIVSNPPYVDANDLESMPDEYRAEPNLALAAGNDGLDLVLPILARASHYLTPHGILVVEVGNSQNALEALLPNVAFTWLEFTRGGQGVFLLTAEQCAALVPDVEALLEQRL